MVATTNNNDIGCGWCTIMLAVVVVVVAVWVGKFRGEARRSEKVDRHQTGGGGCAAAAAAVNGRYLDSFCQDGWMEG